MAELEASNLRIINVNSHSEEREVPLAPSVDPDLSRELLVRRYVHERIEQLLGDENEWENRQTMEDGSEVVCRITRDRALEVQKESFSPSGESQERTTYSLDNVGSPLMAVREGSQSRHEATDLLGEVSRLLDQYCGLLPVS